MYTGHYVSSGSIYGPNGYTKSWIDDDSIYNTERGYTQFYIDGDSIYGPTNRLPWL